LCGWSADIQGPSENQPLHLAQDTQDCVQAQPLYYQDSPGGGWFVALALSVMREFSFEINVIFFLAVVM